MRAVVHLIRTVCISPEVVLVSALFLLWLIYRAPFIWANEQLEAIAWYSIVTPFGIMLAAAVGLAWKILFPPKKGKTLAQWARYPDLRITTMAGIAFVALGAASASLGILGRENMHDGLGALLIACGYVMAGVATFTMLIAALTVRAVLLGGS